MTYDFAPLVTDYVVEWDTPSPGSFSGPLEYYEHGWMRLDNGYVLSLLRMRRNADEEVEEFISAGFEQGLWEVGLMRRAGAYGRLMGMEGEPAPELQDIADEFNAGAETGGFLGVVVNLDNEAVNRLATRVAEEPEVSEDEPDYWQSPLFDLPEVVREFVLIDGEGGTDEG